MNVKRIIAVLRWLGIAAMLSGIVSVYRTAIHANLATVALTLLLLVLFVAANWGLHYAIVTSLAAAVCYNFFFLPPIHTFTISDPQNLLALFVFLITSVFASRSSERIRTQTRDAQARQAELEVLYQLSRALLQADELVQLTNSIPTAVELATGAPSVLFYLLDGDRIYRAGIDWPASPVTPELRELSNMPSITLSPDGLRSIVPLRTGVRPRGVLILREARLSVQTLEALGGLISISLDRAGAVEEVARAEAAKESERLRGLMLDSITHELRTPLTSIKASVSTMLTANLPTDLSRELLTVIDEESDRLNKLVTQAVEMAQLDTQEVRMTFSSRPLAAMIDAAMQTEMAMLAGHEVTLKIPSTLPNVNADPVWIQKLIANLLENAAKYSAPTAPIFVIAEVRGDYVACSVADRGAGIEPMEQSLIFDKFYRSRNRSANTSGTGMGLAICRAIAEAHNGTISVTSQLGQGSVFTFTLPVF
ncbi:MAG TPA: ATP-binding protein [Acidobacteriaceae bacterium]|nr:ATP-binding protein [Acidobacteriaceae bacterium]